MKTTKDGKALYLHCCRRHYGVSTEEAKLTPAFSNVPHPLYKEASYKPYIIAAMIFMQKIKNPAAKLEELWAAEQPVWRITPDNPFS